jgi:hypothetical protein
MNPKHADEMERKRRKRKARRELAALFRRIRAGCRKLDEFDALLEKAGKIKPVLEKYRDVLSAGLVKEVETTLAGLGLASRETHQFCELAERLEKLVDTLYDPAVPRWVQDLLPAAGGGGLVVGVVSALVVIGAVITAFSPLVEATIDVRNQGCEPIPAPQGLPALPGVSFWTQPILDSGHASAKLPPFVRVGVDATQAGTVGLSLFDIGPIPLPVSGVESILLDGSEISGRKIDQTLGVKAEYALVIRCR